ncbi:MAG: TraR/DksA family transcriptional regulator [Desulfococcaceae bacterium]
MNENQIHCSRFKETEPYMNENQLGYFQEKLVRIIRHMSEKVENTRREMQQGNSRRADIADRSELETWRENLLINCEHCQKIIRQSEAALKRIRNKTFGYCVLTGARIGLQRLEIVPYTHLSVDAQELFENNVRYSRWN